MSVRFKNKRVPKSLILLLENYKAREEFILQEIKGKRIINKLWSGEKQKAFIKGMEYAIQICSSPEDFDTIWAENGEILLSKSRKYKNG